MIYAILIVALLLRPHKASFVFVFAATVFNILFGDADGSLYFPLAALCDFTVAGLLFRLRIDRKVLEMMVVSVVSLTLNLLGWLMWYAYEPPDLYVNLFGILYITAFALILKKDGTDVGGTEIYIDHAGYHRIADTGCRMGYQSKGDV